MIIHSILELPHFYTNHFDSHTHTKHGKLMQIRMYRGQNLGKLHIESMFTGIISG